MLDSVNIETQVKRVGRMIAPYDVSNLIRPNFKAGNIEETTREDRVLENTLKIISSPKLLYDIPALPYYYQAPGSPGRLWSRPEADRETFRPAWSELDNPAMIDDWAKNSGYEDLSDVYAEVPLKTVLSVLNPVQKVEHYIRNRTHEGKVRINQILEVMRGYQISQMLAEESYKTGMELIKRHLPEFVPTEPSVVIGDPSFIMAKRENGEYFGKVEGVHVLIIRTPPNPFLKIENYKITDNAGSLVPVIGAHELIHQKHAEVTNGQLGFNPRLGSPLTVEYMRTHTIGEINSLQKEEAVKMGLPVKKAFGEEFGLDVALAEGIATAAELFIDFAEARRLMRLGMRDEAKMFIDAGKTRRGYLREARNIADGLHYAVGTEEIVESLFNTMKISELGNFLAKVDMSKAGNIRYGTPAFDEILKDPKKLPIKE